MNSFLSDILKRRRAADAAPPPEISFTVSAFSQLPSEIHLNICDELQLKDINSMTVLSSQHSIGHIYEEVFISRIKPDILNMDKTCDYVAGTSFVSYTGSDGHVFQLLAFVPNTGTITRILDFYYQHFDEEELALPFIIINQALMRRRADIVKHVAKRLGPERLNSMAGTIMCPLRTLLQVGTNFCESLEVLAECGLDLISKRKTYENYSNTGSDTDAYFCTALHLAVRSGRKAIVETVLRLGGEAIDIHEMDSNGQTAIGVATSLWLLNPSEFDVPQEWKEYWTEDSTFSRRVEVINVLLTVGKANLHRAGTESILERAWNDTRSEIGRHINLDTYFKVFVARMLPILRKKGLVVRINDIKTLKQAGREGGECVDWNIISGAEETKDLGEATLQALVKTLQSEA